MKYIVVDVDGVLNPFSPTVDHFTTHGTVEGNTYPLYLNKKHGQWLLELAEDTGAELIWGTTWQEAANSQIGAQIGLPELTVPKFDPYHMFNFNAQWKADGVLRFVGDSDFVWFDDDYDIAYWINQFHGKGHQILVDDRYGLSEGHIEQARKLLQ